mmetsp:Transcript_30967/g.99902  ORF Transcript_30967/g.99902 Transcript_30967/m.99902 type:complete len:438 (-) Transcript_30967:261-1574(-)
MGDGVHPLPGDGAPDGGLVLEPHLELPGHVRRPEAHLVAQLPTEVRELVARRTVALHERQGRLLVELQRRVEWVLLLLLLKRRVLRRQRRRQRRRNRRPTAEEGPLPVVPLEAAREPDALLGGLHLRGEGVEVAAEGPVGGDARDDLRQGPCLRDVPGHAPQRPRRRRPQRRPYVLWCSCLLLPVVVVSEVVVSEVVVDEAPPLFVAYGLEVDAPVGGEVEAAVSFAGEERAELVAVGSGDHETGDARGRRAEDSHAEGRPRAAVVEEVVDHDGRRGPGLGAEADGRRPVRRRRRLADGAPLDEDAARGPHRRPPLGGPEDRVGVAAQAARRLDGVGAPLVPRRRHGGKLHLLVRTPAQQQLAGDGQLTRRAVEVRQQHHLVLLVKRRPTAPDPQRTPQLVEVLRPRRRRRHRPVLRLCCCEEKRVRQRLLQRRRHR